MAALKTKTAEVRACLKTWKAHSIRSIRWLRKSFFSLKLYIFEIMISSILRQIHRLGECEWEQSSVVPVIGWRLVIGLASYGSRTKKRRSLEKPWMATLVTILTIHLFAILIQINCLVPGPSTPPQRCQDIYIFIYIYLSYIYSIIYIFIDIYVYQLDQLENSFRVQGIQEGLN